MFICMFYVHVMYGVCPGLRILWARNSLYTTTVSIQVARTNLMIRYARSSVPSILWVGTQTALPFMWCCYFQLNYNSKWERVNKGRRIQVFLTTAILHCRKKLDWRVSPGKWVWLCRRYESSINVTSHPKSGPTTLMLGKITNVWDFQIRVEMLTATLTAGCGKRSACCHFPAHRTGGRNLSAVSVHGLCVWHTCDCEWLLFPVFSEFSFNVDHPVQKIMTRAVIFW